jgi:phosphomannomutase
MNRAVVSRTAAGLAIFMKRRGLRSIVIGRDARHGSEDFARDTAEIMAGAGFEVNFLPRPLPTPVLAFAVRQLNLDVGVMVTASHNPGTDNGYKVYLGGVIDGVPYEGSQIISPIDQEIFQDILRITTIKNIPRSSHWNLLDEKIIRAYIHRTAATVKAPRDIKVVYSAMHGVGTETVRSVFHAAGFAEPILVSAQAEPDPDFPQRLFRIPKNQAPLILHWKQHKHLMPTSSLRMIQMLIDAQLQLKMMTGECFAVMKWVQFSVNILLNVIIKEYSQIQSFRLLYSQKLLPATT